MHRPIRIICHEMRNMINSALYNWNLKNIMLGILGVDNLVSKKSGEEVYEE